MIVEGITETINSGSLLLALPLAFAAGLVSFLSPCVLPLVPGYLSFMTGVAGARANGQSVKRSRALLGTVMFIVGFSTVFISFGAVFGGIGQSLLLHQRLLQSVMGVLVIVLGLGFLGVIPALQREVRLPNRPTGTLLGALILGFVFALGWTPCIGPTLAAVQAMALQEASAVRGAILSLSYCLGLGLPFILIGLMMERGVRAIKFLRKHSQLIMRIGGVLLIAIGLLLVTGYWNTVNIWLRSWLPVWAVPL
ncbi:MAG: cytochrome c biogenesis protein CcdA [Actinobacteria bacterium]|nr:cytochrome c biogenesis protein CcdA [Actinomycetota bacterium]NBY16010.1 cytochrome c biogenesis protein CcdA [Actinomycetota bacterium]